MGLREQSIGPSKADTDANKSLLKDRGVQPDAAVTQPLTDPGRDRTGWWTPMKKRVVAGLTTAVVTPVVGWAVLRPRHNEESKKQDNIPGLVTESNVDTSIPTRVTVPKPVDEKPVLTEAQIEQQTVDKLVTDGGYPELKGHIPTFRHEVVTDDSITHIMSFLPESILPKDKFDKDGYAATIAYEEEIAGGKPQFTWSVREGQPAVTEQYISSKDGEQKRVKYVFLTSSSEPVPQTLKSQSEDPKFSALADAIKNGSTYFWTSNSDSKGSSSFLRWSEPNSFKFGPPTEVVNTPLSILEQLNYGLTLEGWISSGRLEPYDYEATESLKQLGAQLIMNGSRGRSESLLQQRWGKLISKASELLYPSKSQKLIDIHNGAPRVTPIKLD